MEYMLITAFGLGIIIQAFLLISFPYLIKKESVSKILAIFFVAFIAFFPGEDEIKNIYSYSLQTHYLFYFILVGVSLYGFFEKKILSTINEGTLLIWNLVFLHILYSMDFERGILLILLGIFLLPSVIVIGINFVNILIPPFLRIFLYIWYLFIVIFISITQFISGNILLWFSKIHEGEVNYLESFLLGMFFFYLITNIMPLMKFLPTKDNDTKSRKEHSELLSSKYSNKQTKPLLSLFLILLINGGLALNAFQNWYDETMMTYLVILILPQLMKEFSSKEAYVLWRKIKRKRKRIAQSTKLFVQDSGK